MKIAGLILFLLTCVQCFWLSNFYHDGYAIKMSPVLQEGGFLYYITVLTSEPPIERNCLIHFNDSLIYINYNVQLAGKNTAFQIHPVLGAQDYFQIGAFEGMLPVIYNYTYIQSFGIEGISCIIGLGAGNVIFKDFRVTPRVIFDNESNDGKVIQCDLLTNELCSFNADVVYNGTLIDTNIRTRISSFYPYTLFPVDIFNTMFFAHEDSGKWSDIALCLSSDSTNCIYITADIIYISVHSFTTTTIQSYDGDEIVIGLSAFQQWDVAYSNSTIRIKERALVISNSFGSQIISIFLSILNFYFLLTPPVSRLKIPERRYLFHFIKNILQGLICILPLFIFAYPKFFYNVMLETTNYIYFLITYQCIISAVGLFSVLFGNHFTWATHLHMILPIISSWNFSFYYSLLDFVEGNPTWGQMILFGFVCILNFTLFIFVISQYVKRGFFQYVHAFFWFTLSILLTVWSTTYFLIPPTQRWLRLFTDGIVVVYFITIVVFLLFARVIYIGASCMLVKIKSVKLKQN